MENQCALSVASKMFIKQIFTYCLLHASIMPSVDTSVAFAISCVVIQLRDKPTRKVSIYFNVRYWQVSILYVNSLKDSFSCFGYWKPLGGIRNDFRGICTLSLLLSSLLSLHNELTTIHRYSISHAANLPQ